MKLLKWIKSLFKETTYWDCIESFVASKNPQTIAEVEHWVRVYDQRQRNWAL